MPSTSPGNVSNAPTPFLEILPGAPTTSLQSLSSFVFRHKRYIVYISGRQVNLLSSPTTLVQALTFDDDLVAVAAETQTGKVVVTSEKDVWVLEPLTEGWTKVWWEKTLFLVREDAGDEARSLSWGNEGEVLIGGSRQLSLFSTLPSSRMSARDDASIGGDTVEERRALWSKNVASAVQYAAFSLSGSLIATCARYDRLVKVWRRLSFEEGLFDYTYLPHPGAVTHLEWRPLNHNLEEHRDSGVSGRHDEESEVLYTLANDSVLRVWRTANLHDLDILILHTTLDLQSAIPESPSLTIKEDSQVDSVSRPARYMFIIPSEEFSAAVIAAIGLQTEKLSHSLEHLKEMSSKDLDVIISLDGQGRMSAWGLQSVGHKRRPETPSDSSKLAFHIAHAEGLLFKIAEGQNARFEAWFEDSKFNILAHSFGGYIQWWRGDVEAFFSTAASGPERLQEAAYWCGHLNRPITTLSGSAIDQELVSYSTSQEIAHWKPARKSLIQNTAVYSTGNRILDLSLVGDSTLVLEESESDPCKINLSLRDSRGNGLGKNTHVLELGDDNAKWRLFGPAYDERNGNAGSQVVGLNNNGRGFVFAVDTANPNKPTLGDLMEFSLPAPADNIPAIHTAAVLDATDPDRVGLVCITKSGSLLLYDLQVAENDIEDPMLMATFESGVQDPSILAVNNEFAAAVSSDRRSLAIVNLRDGYVEHRESMAGQIRHIVPGAKHNLIAVGYDTSVNILTQGRYEHHEEMPPWILVKQISIADMGLSISALAWRGDGSLAIAAGNGIFLSSNDVPVEELHNDVQEAIDIDPKSQETRRLSHLAQQLKKPLPVWHPSLVSHIIRHGHWSLASGLVSSLLQKLKFWSEGDVLHPHLDIPAEQLYGGRGISNDVVLDDSSVTDLMQQLEEKDLPEVSQSEQQRLKGVLQAMTFCSEHVKCLDNGALRFLFSWKLELLHLDAKELPNGTGPNGPAKRQQQAVPEMHWREIAFAFHSTTQQPLLDILVTHYDNKVTWQVARRLGLFAWLSEREALDRIFEALAQSAYRAASPPDPINASLYFLAMHKKPTLLALWRMATWHKEQRATMNFLRRDFTQPENKTAARKNAYALMGKKRFDYAAAFFLLAEDPASATSVLASQCGDIMLAIAVGRLYSGDGSPVLRKLIENRLMPQAVQKGDRWLTSWCHSILFERDYAAEALVKPLEGVRTWQQDDPHTLTLYRHLRKVDSEHEYDAILRAARILRRMGLWLLALELVNQWEFKPPPVMPSSIITQKAATNGVHEAPPAMLDDFTGSTQMKEPPSMLDGFTAPQPAPPVQDEKAAREAKAAELLKKLKAKKEEIHVISEKKAEPTQFKEPDANSLLDSFGF